jgi:hypothetical protein
VEHFLRRCLLLPWFQVKAQKKILLGLREHYVSSCFSCFAIHNDHFGCVFFAQELSDELSIKQKELQNFKASGLCDGQILPQNQMDNLFERFDRLATRLNQLQRKVAYEHSKSQLTLLISLAESRSKMWSIKYGGREDVKALLEDYQVRSGWRTVICKIDLSTD